jgi:hypothetical protein
VGSPLVGELPNSRALDTGFGPDIRFCLSNRLLFAPPELIAVVSLSLSQRAKTSRADG